MVFLPLNLIASIGGMSTFSIMTAGVPRWVAYPLSVLAMMTLGGVMVNLLKRVAQVRRGVNKLVGGVKSSSRKFYFLLFDS